MNLESRRRQIWRAVCGGRARTRGDNARCGWQANRVGRVCAWRQTGARRGNRTPTRDSRGRSQAPIAEAPATNPPPGRVRTRPGPPNASVASVASVSSQSGQCSERAVPRTRDSVRRVAALNAAPGLIRVSPQSRRNVPLTEIEIACRIGTHGYWNPHGFALVKTELLRLGGARPLIGVGPATVRLGER